jgi:glutaredoxin 3
VQNWLVLIFGNEDFSVKTRLFIKPYCGWCDKAMRWLDDHDIAYEKLDVIADDAAFAEMVRLSGQELAPVLDVDGKILADFGPEELPRFFKNISTTDGHG